MNDRPLDLRAYLDSVSDLGTGSYLEIEDRISPRFETTAVVTRLAERMRSPVIRFNNVKDCALPMVTNVCSSFDRVARSVGISTGDLTERMQNALTGGLGSVELRPDDAPIRAVVRASGTFSLYEFPALYYSAGQTAPYITAAIIVARDPQSGAHNLSFHRLMVKSADEVGIYITPNSHLDQIWRSNRASGDSTPIAAVIGAHPLWCFGALTAGDLGDDDYEAICAVTGQPLETVSGLQDPDLKIPARAEIVLEGAIEPEKTATEGPFGEFLGFEAEQDERPLVRFNWFTSRAEPIFQDIVAGQIEHMTMSGAGLRARLQRDYFAQNKAITDYWLPAAMTLFLAVNAECEEVFDARAFMAELLQKERYLKQVACFDAGTDLRKLGTVQSAIACFVQADRDIEVFSGCDGNGVDPSEIDGKTSKIAIDARASAKVVRTEFPEEIAASFDLSDWI